MLRQRRRSLDQSQRCHDDICCYLILFNNRGDHLKLYSVDLKIIVSDFSDVHSKPPPQLASTYSTESKHDQSPDKIVSASIGGACGIIIIIVAGLIWYVRSRRPFLSQQRESVTPHQEPRVITQVQKFEVSRVERRQESSDLSLVELDGWKLGPWARWIISMLNSNIRPDCSVGWVR